MKVLKVNSRCFGWSIEATCTFIGWFEFATGFLGVIGYLTLVVLVGIQIVKDESENVIDPAKYYTIAASSISAIVIEFYMMLGWYLLLGIYKEDSDRLKMWIRAAIILYSCMFGGLIVWIIGLCCHPSAYLLMMFPTCHCVFVNIFGIYSIFVVKLCYTKLAQKKAANGQSMENDENAVVPSLYFDS